MVENVFILLVLTLSAGLLIFHPKLAGSRAWKAMVTPLASIMGSGFLVCAPLLASNAGYDAIFAMLVLLVLAFFIGGALRFNIRFVEPLLESGQPGAFARVEASSRWILSIAYVISISYYLQLLAAFVLHMIQVEDLLVAKSLTTLVLLGVALMGASRGLGALESLERYAIGLNLGTIASLIFGLAWYNFVALREGQWSLPDLPPVLDAHSYRVVLGGSPTESVGDLLPNPMSW